MTKLNQIPIPELFVSPEAAGKLAAEGARLPGWRLTRRQLCDLELLMNGGFFPLKGFMTQADCEHVARDMRLASGALWPVPVTLEVGEDFAARIEPGDDIGLLDGQDVLLAIMSVTDHWRPGGGMAGPVCLGGKVKGLRPPAGAGTRPNHLRGLFRDHDRDQVVALDDCAALPVPEGMVAMLMLLAGDIPAAEHAGLRRRYETAIAGHAGACMAEVNLVARGQGIRILVLQALVARNHGATHVLAGDEPELGKLLEEAGLLLLPHRG
ncbi:transcription antiterminator BlgG [Paracoccus alkanivorans]|uniref:Transcription antiterminator BlgG n=1 Tax=Paracoccus alkanivorans TaxID=2116655 RepID=A0A3M0M923_9RHOB|nr:transcription antiterminator BlgG [Paracoccus alkanivorans]RMC33825.1 transcription antiterminator BlgG [Paracoccus alkanivorans]